MKGLSKELKKNMKCTIEIFDIQVDNSLLFLIMHLLCHFNYSMNAKIGMTSQLQNLYYIFVTHIDIVVKNWNMKPSSMQTKVHTRILKKDQFLFAKK